MIPLSLDQIAAVVGGVVEGDGAVTVTAPTVLDGRLAEPGGLFVAFAGEHADGHDYASQAGRAGAVAVLGSRPTRLPTVVVEDTQGRAAGARRPRRGPAARRADRRRADWLPGQDQH